MVPIMVVLIIFPVILQTVINVTVLSTGGEEAKKIGELWSINKEVIGIHAYLLKLTMQVFRPVSDSPTVFSLVGKSQAKSCKIPSKNSKWLLKIWQNTTGDYFLPHPVN